VSGTHLAPMSRFLLLLDSYGLLDVGRPLWQEVGSVVYSCCWATPAQPLSVPSRTKLMTTSYSLKFKTPSTMMAGSSYLYPQAGWPSYNPRALSSLFVTSYNSQGCGGDVRPTSTWGDDWFQSQSQQQLMVSQPVCPGIRPLSGARDKFCFLHSAHC
jgi:hypothetical protein